MPLLPAMFSISNHSTPAGIVFEPFTGTGTTMIACENLGRKCRGCELDPGYVAVILQRYKDTFPGKEIKLIS
jgi:DNA modification methylase